MAARYVDTANIVAQGQSFYTGLLPGSYEKGGGGGGSNVMGKGSGGSAGVSADRTGSTAAQQSITGYPKGGSILGKEKDDSQTININLGGEDGGLQTPDPDLRGSGGQSPPQWTPSTRGDVIDVDYEEIGPGRIRAGGGREVGPGGTGQLALPPGGPQGLGSMIPGAPYGGVGQGTRPQQGLGTGQKPQHQGGSVQRMASTRAHTRQPGVQQSATQQSIPFPNMANSTDRSLNF